MTTITELFLAIWNYTNPAICGLVLGITISLVSIPRSLEKIRIFGVILFLTSLCSLTVLNHVDGEKEFAILDKKDSSGKWILQTKSGTYITSPFTQAYYFSKGLKEFCLLDPDKKSSRHYKGICQGGRITQPEKFAEQLSTLSKFSVDNTKGAINSRRVLHGHFRTNGFPDSLPDFVEFKLVETGK